MGLGAEVQSDDGLPGNAPEAEPDYSLKRAFPGLGRIADATQQFEDVLRDFVTIADPDTSK